MGAFLLVMCHSVEWDEKEHFELEPPERAGYAHYNHVQTKLFMMYGYVKILLFISRYSVQQIQNK